MPHLPFNNYFHILRSGNFEKKCYSVKSFETEPHKKEKYTCNICIIHKLPPFRHSMPGNSDIT